MPSCVFSILKRNVSRYRGAESFVTQGVNRKSHPKNILSTNASKNTGYVR